MRRNKELEIDVNAKTKKAEDQIDKLGDKSITVDIGVDISAIRDLQKNINIAVKNIQGQIESLGRNLDKMGGQFKKTAVEINSTVDKELLGNKRRLPFEDIGTSISNIENLIAEISKLSKVFKVIETTNSKGKKELIPALQTSVRGMKPVIDALTKITDYIDVIQKQSSGLSFNFNTKSLADVNEELSTANNRVNELSEKLKGIYAKKKPTLAVQSKDDFSNYFNSKNAQGILKNIIKSTETFTNTRGLKAFGETLTAVILNSEDKLKDFKIQVDDVEYSIEQISELFVKKLSNTKEFKFTGINELKELIENKSSVSALSKELDAIASRPKLGIEAEDIEKIVGEFDKLAGKLEEIRALLDTTFGELKTSLKTEGDLEVTIKGKLSDDFVTDLQSQIDKVGDFQISVKPVIDKDEKLEVEADIKPKEKNAAQTRATTAFNSFHKQVLDYQFSDNMSPWIPMDGAKADPKAYGAVRSELNDMAETVLRLQKEYENFDTNRPIRELEKLEDELRDAEIRFAGTYSAANQYWNEGLDRPGNKGGASKKVQDLYGYIMSGSGYFNNEAWKRNSELLENKAQDVENHIQQIFKSLGTNQISSQNLFSWIEENGTVAEKEIFRINDGLKEFRKILRGLATFSGGQFDFAETLGLDTVTFNQNPFSSDTTTTPSAIDEITQAEDRMGNEAKEATDQMSEGAKEVAGNLHLITDELGNIKVFYRGLRDSMGQGLVSDRFNGATFWTDSFDLAKEYSNWTKVESANLSMIKPLEIQGNGANWNNIEYLGTGIDEASKKIIEAKNKMLEDLGDMQEYAEQEGYHFKEITSKYGMEEFRRYMSEVWLDVEGFPDEIKQQMQRIKDKVEEGWAEYQAISNDDSNVYGRHNTKEFVALAQKSGQYDGVIFKDIIDSASGVVRDATNVVVQFNEDKIKFIETLKASDNLNERDIDAITQNYSQIVGRIDQINQEGRIKVGDYDSDEVKAELQKEAELYEKILPLLTEYKDRLIEIRNTEVDRDNIVVPQENKDFLKNKILSSLKQLYSKRDVLTLDDVANEFKFNLFDRDEIGKPLLEVLTDETTTTKDLLLITDQLYEQEFKRYQINAEIRKQKNQQVSDLSKDITAQYRASNETPVSTDTSKLSEESAEVADKVDKAKEEIKEEGIQAKETAKAKEELAKAEQSVASKSAEVADKVDKASKSIKTESEEAEKLANAHNGIKPFLDPVKDAEEWNRISEAAHKYSDELGEIVRIQRDVSGDKESVLVTGRNNQSITLGKNSDGGWVRSTQSIEDNNNAIKERNKLLKDWDAAIRENAERDKKKQIQLEKDWSDAIKENIAWDKKRAEEIQKRGKLEDAAYAENAKFDEAKRQKQIQFEKDWADAIKENIAWEQRRQEEIQKRGKIEAAAYAENEKRDEAKRKERKKFLDDWDAAIKENSARDKKAEEERQKRGRLEDAAYAENAKRTATNEFVTEKNVTRSKKLEELEKSLVGVGNLTNKFKQQFENLKTELSSAGTNQDALKIYDEHVKQLTIDINAAKKATTELKEPKVKQKEEKTPESVTTALDTYEKIWKTKLKIADLDAEKDKEKITALQKQAQEYQDIYDEQVNALNAQERSLLKAQDLLDIETEYTEKIKQASRVSDAEKHDDERNKYISDIEDLQKQLDKLSAKAEGKDRLQIYIDQIKELKKQITRLPQPDIITDQETGQLTEYIKLVEVLKARFGAAENKEANENMRQKMLGRVNDILSSNTKRAFKITDVYDDLVRLQKTIRDFDTSKPQEELNNLNAELLKTEARFKDLDSTVKGKGFLANFSNRLADMNTKFIAQYFSFQDWIRYIRTAATAVADLDKQMVELSKVSGQTLKQIQGDFASYAETAKDLGATITDTISATADWSRMGYSVPDAKELARVALLYKNVGDGIDISTANENLISTLQGFQMTADESEKIVDVFNEVYS